MNLPFTRYDLAERVSLIKTAMGLLPADNIITNIKLVEVNTGDILEGVCILIKGHRIAGIVKVDCIDKYRGVKTLVINGDGYYAMPGFIDLHVHIESSMLDPIGFSKLALKHGTTTVVADPHEIVNVLGLEGLKVFIEATKKSPLKILLEVPSCVPPTDPSMNLETPASLFPHSEFVEALDLEGIVGLGEVMDFLSVINANEGVLHKIMHASNKDLLLNGHAPLLTPEELNAYISAGVLSDHESTNLSEAFEKAWRGMYLYIREGSAWRDLKALIEIARKRDCKLCTFVSDDVNVVDLVEQGHMDRIINRAIELGLDPVKAIQLATINSALRLNLEDHIGIVAPGRLGDIVLSKGLERIEPETIMANGELVYYRRELVKNVDKVEYPPRALNTVKVDIETVDNMAISPSVNLESGLVKVNVIRVEPGSALTKHVVEEVEVSSGVVLPNPEKDVMYVGVLYRHAPKGGYSVGLIQNLNFKLGAVAQTIAHDTHNIIFAGWNKEDIRLAIKRVVELQGGIVVVDRGRVVAELPLRLAGLMSIEEPEVVYERYKKLTRVLKEHGSDFEYVFMTLSLVSLPVIPEIRITDKGLVNVKKGELLKLVVGR